MTSTAVSLDAGSLILGLLVAAAVYYGADAIHVPAPIGAIVALLVFLLIALGL